MLKLDVLTALLGTSLVHSTQFFSLLTIPYFVGVHKDDFDTSLWGNWFRIFSYFFSTLFSLTGLATSLLSSRSLLYTTLSGLVLSLAMTVYNVLFGLRVPALVLCYGDTRHACMESTTLCGAPNQVKTWEAFLFSFSLCVLMCVQSAAVSAISWQLSRHQISLIPISPHTQVPTDVSARGIEASTIIVETQKAPKPGLEEKALIEGHFIRKPEEPVPAKAIKFGVDEKTADLFSMKDFETSSNHTKPDRSLGRRGRGKK